MRALIGSFLITVTFITSVHCIRFELGPCLLQYLEPCTEDVIQYYLFSSDQLNAAPLILNSTLPNIPDMYKFKNWNTKLIIHGYGGNIDFHATKTIRNAYLSRNRTNVILVDWGKLAKLPCYPTAVYNTKQAGECTASFLIRLQNAVGLDHLDLEKIHMIGFSLGAHIISFISNSLFASLKIKVNRLTGLDPALPFFTTSNNKWKLDRSDAKFVDIIHTNAGVYGKIEPSGHVDFYLNGGRSQPACHEHRNIPLCSHMLSTVYFAESINSVVGFWGLKCSSYIQYFLGMCSGQNTWWPWSIYNDDGRYNEIDNNWRHHNHRKKVLMGEHCSKEVTGVYFVNTNLLPPYALGINFTSLQLSSTMLRVF